MNEAEKQIRLKRDFRSGCHSLDREEREKAVGGLFIRKGTIFDYSNGWYIFDTHSFKEDEIDWNLFEYAN